MEDKQVLAIRDDLKRNPSSRDWEIAGLLDELIAARFELRQYRAAYDAVQGARTLFRMVTEQNS